ncbi:MAG: MerR family transcriptional regulator [Rhodoglobus sp.]
MSTIEGERVASNGSSAAVLKIGHVASIVGVSASRIRLWEHESLITPTRTEGGQRCYSPEDVERLKKIRDLLETKSRTFRGVRELLSTGDLGATSDHSASNSVDPAGEQVKRRRIELGLTLRNLARMSDVSPSALSAFERGLSKPNTGRISKIAHALNMTVAELLGVPRQTDQMIVRAGDRTLLAFNEEGISYELLYKTSTSLQSASVIVEAGCGLPEAITHSGEDFITVITGQIDVILDSIETHTLYEGDSITFPSHRPHSVQNTGTSATRLIWVNTPATF